MANDVVTIRPRVPADLAPLATALVDQQPETRYPFRDPLPFPVAEFLHADDAVTAWTAERDGHVVGHACRTDRARASVGDLQMSDECAQAHGCDVTELTWVGALFVTPRARGLGVGRRLLDAVVDDARSGGRHPCLEVLPVHPGAIALYLSAGWRVVRSMRPDWLRDAAGDSGPDVAVMVLTS